MARYDINKPWVGPSASSQLASSVGDALEVERQRRRQEQEQGNFERTAAQGDRRLDQADRAADQDALEAGFDLNLARSTTAAAGRGDEPRGIGPDEFEAEPGFRMPEPEAPAATSSGAAANVATPTASEIRHPTLGARNYRNSTGGQSQILQDELGAARTRAGRVQAEADRDRRIAALVTQGRSQAEAASIVDQDLNLDDVSPEYTRPGFRDARRLELGDETAAAIAEERGRQRARNEGSGGGSGDGGGGMAPIDIDRFGDAARADLSQATAELGKLDEQLATMRHIPDGDPRKAQLAQRRTELQATVADLRARSATYRSAADSAFARGTGTQFGQPPVKKPSREQLAQAARDPDYADFLVADGYEMPSPYRRR